MLVTMHGIIKEKKEKKKEMRPIRKSPISVSNLQTKCTVASYTG